MIERLSPLRCALLTAVPALLYRVFLATVYFGQEEEDWGNLGLIVGTAQSGFGYIETEHMPLYTTLSAVLYRITGDAQVAGELLAITMGALTVGLVAFAAARWLSPTTGLLAGVLVAVQPDLALLSSTTLRTSTYTAFAVATVLAAGERRWLLAGALFWGAFLTRFDAMLGLLPALLLGAATPWLDEPADRGPGRRFAGAGIALAVLPTWALIYNAAEGTPKFWQGVVDRNTGNFEDLGLLDRLGKGLETLWLVAGNVLPDHLSWCVLALVPLGLVGVLRGRARNPRAARWLGFAAVAMTGVFLATVLLSAYRWDHNLYWKWLAVSLPLSLPLAAHGAVLLVQRVGGRGGQLLAVGLALATALPMYRQTWHQLIRSDAWMGTQVRLADWTERATSADTAVLADLVPATWLSRHPDPKTVYRWSQVKEELPTDAPGFGQWLLDHRVGVVIWFAEEWVGAAQIAPWLGEARPIEAGPVRLTPIAEESGYGFVAWSVSHPSLPPPTAPVPADAGAIQR